MPSFGLRLGIVILPELPWREAEPVWRAADDMGFDHLWTYDHLVWGGLPDHPWHSTVATLAAAAMVTSRARLGTFVTSPNFRHPALLAKDVTTLDDLSDGRMMVGMGAGGDLDSRLLGADLSRAERSRRFAEFVPLLDRLLTQERVDHTGEFYTVRDAATRPGCVQHPRVPFVVAANGPRAMRLATRHGSGWVTTGTAASAEEGLEAWWQGVGTLAAALDEAEAEDAQRSAARALDRYLSLDSSGVSALASVEFARDQIGRAAAAGFTDVVLHWPRTSEPYRAEMAVLEELLG